MENGTDRERDYVEGLPFRLVKGTEGGLRFVIDGKTYTRSGCGLNKDGSPRDFYSRDRKVTNALLQCSIEQLGWPEFIAFYYQFELDGVEYGLFLSRVYDRSSGSNVGTDDYKLSFYADPDLSEWSLPFTFAQYLATMEDVVKELAVEAEVKRYDSHEDNSLHFIYEVTSQSGRPLRELIMKPLEDVTRASAATASLLTHSTVVQTTFSFPPEVKTACEQYLLYFAQFLRDIGITATASITEEAGEVLFSVQPVDPDDGLRRIREALEVYLQLPTLTVESEEHTFAVERLEFQLDALKFQLRTQERELRMAEREISRQERAIDSAFSLLEHITRVTQDKDSRGLLVQAAQTPEGSDSGRVLGLTKVKKLEDYGLHLDLGELMKRLKKSKAE